MNGHIADQLGSLWVTRWPSKGILGAGSVHIKGEEKPKLDLGPGTPPIEVEVDRGGDPE